MTPDIADALKLAAQDIPEEINAWLGRLVLLYGVPFNYLIPEEEMLPAESIRFFFLDPIWIQYLVQGACSVGNTGYGDTIVDRAMDKWVQPNQPGSNAQAILVNKAAAGIRDRLRNQREGAALPQESADLDWPLTGFLLRSAVVRGWRGLEVMAYGKASEEQKKHGAGDSWTDEQKEKLEQAGVAPLKSLRIEQLSPDVMLGIFNGIIAQLVIRQPQEGLHFGLTRDGPSYTKTLRELGYKLPANTGQILKDQIDLSQLKLMREKRGVIDIAGLAGRMRDTLSNSDELQKDPVTQNVKFTSSEFAVQMIEAAGEFTFIPESAQRS